mmetsp:Transcript_95522/g.270431  ORF Transcript_95522/g.270431 Transcript_95522/m.270431 type:complete len:266 (+) Transcript_95522:3-800(+)
MGGSLAQPLLSHDTSENKRAHDRANLMAYRWLKAGGRGIDTFPGWRDDEHVAKAVDRAGLNRRNVWVTAHLIAPRAYDPVFAEEWVTGLNAQIGAGWIDLLLLQKPAALGLTQNDTNSKLWEDLERLVDSKKIKALGLAGWDWPEVQALHYNAKRHRVAVLQRQRDVAGNKDSYHFDMCRSLGIKYQSHTPTGVGRASLDSKVVQEIAKRRGKTPAQVALKWAIQRYDGFASVVFMSERAGTQVEDADLHSWDLWDEDLAELDRL